MRQCKCKSARTFKATAGVLFLLLLLVSASFGAQDNEEAWGANWGQTEASIDQLRLDYPQVQFQRDNGRVTRIYGHQFGSGTSPEDAAEQFRLQYAEALGAEVFDLQPVSLLPDKRHTQPVMYDAETDSYKFTLVYYSQFRGDVPVYQADLRVLVRNEPGYPVVLVSSGLRNLGDFYPSSSKISFDPAVHSNTGMTKFSETETVIWAGISGQNVKPRLAATFIGENDRTDAGYEVYRYICDAATGEILYQESLIRFVDITGNVQAMATPGPKAGICTPEILFPYPWARVEVSGGPTVYADRDGNYTIPWVGSSAVTVTSYVDGIYFSVDNRAGAEETLSQLTTPPGPADFTHNEANTDDLVLAQTNVYISANGVRDWVLDQNPSYPGLPSETGVPTVVNRTDFYCPCNAWSSSSDGSINFCQSGSGCPNTGWQSVVNHEYGHHVIDFSSSGQGEYGEGMSDCFSMLPVDNPVLGYGFSGDCNSGLRTADNNCQYLASGCSTCGSEIHDCGMLLSGCVWDIRNELVITEPVDYLSILSSLAVNSILLHTGTSINSDIAVDFLTLDDDDANLDNGTPHWNEICTGFTTHGIECPELTPIWFSFPSGIPQVVDPLVQTAVRVVVNTGGVAPVSGSGKLYYSLDGSAFVEGTMTEVGTDEYDAMLPATNCDVRIDWYVSAEAPGFGEVTDPSNAPTSVHSAVVATSVTVEFSDDFETDQGWTVSGDAGDGQWMRAIPAGGGDRGDPPTDYDGSGRCYVTDNADDNSDVDDGTTSLTSPVIDLSAGDALIHYARWYSNNYGADPYNDVMEVYISNNNGSNWVLAETVGPEEQAAGGWYEHEFFVSEFVEPTSQIRIRVDASDLSSGSVVEAGFDDFSVTMYECQSAPQVVILSEGPFPQWTQNLPGYYVELEADYGTEPYVWSDKYGDLSSTGLTLSSDGVISGTPTASGALGFTAYVEDADLTFDEKALSITINAELQITTASLPDWTVGRFFNQTLAASGGTGTHTWNDQDGGLSGTGLLLNESTGQIYGTPTSEGTISFMARATDILGATDDQAYEFYVNPGIDITTDTLLPSWMVGVPGYAVQLEYSGGTPPVSWQNIHDDLEGTGLTMSSDGLISGTPIVSGSLSFSAKVTDNVGAFDLKQFHIEIATNVQITTTSPLPEWTVTQPGYSTSLAASGGAPPYAWVDLGGDLSGTGLALAGDGTVSGTPAGTGTVTFTAHVTDSLGLTDEQQFDIDINPWPSITTPSPLPEWTVDIDGYSIYLVGSDGTGSLTWSDKNGDLTSTGLILRTTGRVIGTPVLTGDLNFTALVEDGAGATVEQEYLLHVNEHVVILTDATLPDGTEEEPGYSVQLESSGGTGAVTWSEEGTGLDGTGLALSGAGLVSGTPTAMGTIVFTTNATDALGDEDQKEFTIQVLQGWLCGDADGNELVNISDAVYLITYIFGSGPAPDPLLAGDADCTGIVNISDAVYLIAFIFGGGPAPCADCP